MSRGFWAARRPGWVAGGALLAVVSLTVMLFREKSGGNAATILSLPVAIASLGVALWGLRPIPTSSSAARDLAGRVAQERGQARRQALGMSADARPAKIAFRSPLASDEPELVRWRSDGGAEHGSLTDVANYYQSLERGRMVVLGPPGSGKTMLATQLVIDLTQTLPGGELQPGARPPVPVWLSLPSLDLGEPDSLDRLSAEELAAMVDQWIITQTAEDYQIRKATAQKLVEERWILPVLDGLDEMDTPRAGTGNPRPLAAAVVRALNAGTGRRPVVLVCRRAEYGQLARSSTARWEDPVLQDATQIVLQPLDVTAVCDFLARRFPGRQAGELDVRWDKVRRTLQDATTSPLADRLIQVLGNPWQLFLATTAYQDVDTDPGELIRMPGGEIGGHLLDRLIPALALSTPRPDGDYYPPSEVRAWLGAIAGHLERTSQQLGWSPTDLRLERLWPISGQKKVRFLSAVTTATIICLGIPLTSLAWVVRNNLWYPVTWSAWTSLIFIALCASVLSILAAYNFVPPLTRVDLRLIATKSRRRLAGALAVGLMVGLATWLAVWRLTGLIPGEIGGGPTDAVVSGLVLGLLAGLVTWVTGGFSLAEKPTSVMRQNAAFWLACGLAMTLAVWLLTTRAARIYGEAPALVSGLAIGLGVGLIILMIGLVVWVRYMLGCWLARRQGLLPRRVGRFLDWAYKAKLLRMSGTAIQFRHRELQEWLSLHRNRSTL